MWTPKRTENVLVTDSERTLYLKRDPASLYHAFQWPEDARHGIDKSGHFPIAVARQTYSDQGYECWISARHNEVCPSYLLERLPDIGQKDRDPAYCKIEEEFGSQALKQLHAEAADKRRQSELRAAGGDPDLFVKNLSDPTDRFFVEVKLANPARSYRDKPNVQQELLFPLIEEILKCDVRLFVVTVSARL